MSESHRLSVCEWAAVIAVMLSVLFRTTPTVAQDVLPDEVPAFIGADQETLETQFAEKLSGSALVGQFTVESGDGEDELRPRTERYDFVEVRKLRGSLWLFRARIQYGDHDVTLPITLPVEWAGDTPVIIVDNVGFPGLGTYSARVMFHGDRYVGTWQGTNHGGHMFGRIERDDPAAETEDTQEQNSGNQVDRLERPNPR